MEEQENPGELKFTNNYTKETEQASATINKPENQEKKSVATRKSSVSGPAIASMILGILGVIFTFTYFLSPISILLGIIGLIMGITSNKKSRSGFAIAGIATSIVSMVLGALELASCIGFFSFISNSIRDGLDNFQFGPFQQYIEDAQQTLII